MIKGKQRTDSVGPWLLMLGRTVRTVLGGVAVIFREDGSYAEHFGAVNPGCDLALSFWFILLVFPSMTFTICISLSPWLWLLLSICVSMLECISNWKRHCIIRSESQCFNVCGANSNHMELFSHSKPSKTCYDVGILSGGPKNSPDLWSVGLFELVAGTEAELRGVDAFGWPP